MKFFFSFLPQISKRFDYCQNLTSSSRVIETMSQKSITSFFQKTPIQRTIKRNSSEEENIDSTNVLQADKKIKLASEAIPDVKECRPSTKLIDKGLDPKPTDLESSNGQKSVTSQQIEVKKLMAELKLMSKTLHALHPNMGLTWFTALKNEFCKPYFKRLSKFLEEERSKPTPVFPRPEDVWSWTRACQIEDVKVVIIGQDPYHHPGQAHGLCFSVPVGVATPPSLLNMYKELEADIEGFKKPGHGYLIGWARQGVLLLNAVLTVKSRTPNSHKDQGWEKLTDAVIRHLNAEGDGIVFLLWGMYAQKKADCVDQKRHHLLKSVHPSPLSASRGFIGCKHFSKCNELLVQQGKTPIDWNHLPTE